MQLNGYFHSRKTCSTDEFTASIFKLKLPNKYSVRVTLAFGILFTCFFNSNFSFAQTTDELLKIQESKLEEQQLELDKILKEIEDLKLKKLKTQLQNYIPKDQNRHEIITHSGMILSYNEEHEQPNWVMHIIPKDVITGTVNRTNNFRIDPKVSTGSAETRDYWDSGYDRGHMAPSADFRWSRKALSESYYYSNISPQTPQLNRRVWSSLETQIREWVIEYGDLLIITGPVLREDLSKIPQGSNRVSIPELHYKIVVDLKHKTPKAVAFIFENTKDVQYNLKESLVTIDSIEALTGIDFFPNIADAEKFESTSNLSDWKTSSTLISEAPAFKYDLENVPAKQASYFIGADCNICGEAVATRYNVKTKSAITYINFDQHYPNSPFTAVIFGKDRINFTYDPEVYLKGKMICVRGKVQLYRGKPQIVATHEKQFTIYQHQTK